MVSSSDAETNSTTHNYLQFEDAESKLAEEAYDYDAERDAQSNRSLSLEFSSLDLLRCASLSAS